MLDWTTDRLIATEQGTALVMGLIDEVSAAAAALGVPLSRDIARRQVEKTRPMAAYQTSMQVDRREGRPMEVEAILGEPLRHGTAAGAEMPRLRMLYEMARMVDVTK